LKLVKLQNKKNLINYNIKQLKKEIRKKEREKDKKEEQDFKYKYKKVFLIFDIAMVIVILFNLGALLLTNAMVVKEEPNKTFYESNVVVADKFGYVPHEDAEEEFDAFKNLIMFYWKILVLYFVMRMTTLKLMRTEWMVYVLAIFISYFFVLFGYDFFHDFGFWIGKFL